MPESKSKIKNIKSKGQVKSRKLVVKANSLLVPAYSLDGKEAGSLELSKVLFGAKINKNLLAQALRVYQNNQKGHFANTKTRSEASGSTRKIRAQKGTGGARHGSVRAPIFVGGGIALGPKFRKVILDLPKKMKKAALITALSSKMAEKEIFGIKGLEKASGKTAEMRKFLQQTNKKNALFVVDEKNEKFIRAVRNLPGVKAVASDQVNILEIIQYQVLFMTGEAVEKLESRMK